MRTMTLAADAVPQIDPTYSDEELFNLMRLASLASVLGYSLDVGVSYLDADTQGGLMFTTLADKRNLNAATKTEVAKITANILKLTKENAPALRANAQIVFDAVDRIAKELAIRGYDTKWMTLIYQKDTKQLLAVNAWKDASSMTRQSKGAVDFVSFMARPFAANLEDFRQCKKRAELMASLKGIPIPPQPVNQAPVMAGIQLGEPISLSVAIAIIVGSLVAIVAVGYMIISVLDSIGRGIAPILPEVARATMTMLEKIVSALMALVGSFSWLIIALGIAVFIGGILVVPRVIEYAEHAWTKYLPKPAGMSPATASTAAAAAGLSPVPVASLFADAPRR